MGTSKNRDEGIKKRDLKSLLDNSRHWDDNEDEDKDGKVEEQKWEQD